VLPDYQGRHIGRDVLRALLAESGERTAALSALEPDGSRARRLYTSEGFIPLLSHFRFPGGPTRYAVLAKRLRPSAPGLSAPGPSAPGPTAPTEVEPKPTTG
jgi:ribosomal protein S18 acetylase RimI-like enzyme